MGIDIGTSAAKGALVGEDGAVIASASHAYPISRPKPGWTEQNSGDWWAAIVRTCRDLLGHAAQGDIKALGFSGQLHGSVFLDRDAIDGARTGPVRTIRPVILWNDQRSAGQCGEILDAIGGASACVDAVGNTALPSFTLTKLLWLRANEPELFGRVAAVVNPKDDAVLRCTGVLATDVGDASGTLAFDPVRSEWSGAMLGAVGIDPGVFPRAHESCDVVGGLTAYAAAELGLAEGTPVVAGSGDNMCGAVGAGVVTRGQVLATLGTSGVIYAHADEPRPDREHARLHLMRAAAGPGSWCNTGVTLAAGDALAWARSAIAPGVSFEGLMLEAGAASPGCEGLVFLPHLSGERCPHPDPGARGAWIGLHGRHTRGHLIRAVIEGVTFTMATILDLMRTAGVPVESVRLGGGGNRSELWRQMQADCYGTAVSLPSAEVGPALGAGLLAGVGAGHWRTVAEACGAAVRDAETRDPGADAGVYGSIREVFERVYGEIAGSVRRLSDASSGYA